MSLGECVDDVSRAHTPTALVCFWSRDACTVAVDSFPGSRSRPESWSNLGSYLIWRASRPLQSSLGCDSGTSRRIFFPKSRRHTKGAAVVASEDILQKSTDTAGEEVNVRTVHYHPPRTVYRNPEATVSYLT